MTNRPQFAIGQKVYLDAARVFCGIKNCYVDEPRHGPLTVNSVYLCGQHWRVKASAGNSYFDSNHKLFSPA